MTRKSIWQGIIGLVLVLGMGAPAGAAAAGLGDAIGRLVAGAGKMKMGIRVETAGPNPSVVYELNPNESFQPASNQKIVTTAAAMCLLSPDFTYRTLLAVRGNDLVIIGAGDPSCGDPRVAQEAKEPITAMFHAWAEKLQAAGLTDIKGDLLFDDSIFDNEYLLDSWRSQKFNAMAWYCAPVGGLNFNDNCVDVLVKPGSGPGSTPEVTLVPGTSWITLQNNAKTAGKGEPIVKRLGDNPLIISVNGPVSRANSPESPLSIPITDPGMFFASTCRTALAAAGIRIAGETKRARVRQADGSLPADLRTVAAHEQKMSEILWRANKSSVNMFGEAVLKTVGAYAGREDRPGVGSYQSGRAAVQRFLDGLHVPREGYVVDDGSGLSHKNLMTPAMLTAILQHMNEHPLKKQWWDNLAVPGEQTGTLRRRMRDLTGKVFAKTGHIEGVSTLSGYVIGADKQVYVFSILCNEKSKAKVPPNDFQDNICRTLAKWGTGKAATKEVSEGTGRAGRSARGGKARK
jgi:D-alanyl-D-alanine carboxypeptidase/D-alanyl-D-alanine-endopeptidase (penicillin-binding protein 4)